MSGDSNEPAAHVKCPSCGEDLHNVDLGARAALRGCDEKLEAVRDQRDAIAVELAELRRAGRAQVDRLQERVNELKRQVQGVEVLAGTPTRDEAVNAIVIHHILSIPCESHRGIPAGEDCPGPGWAACPVRVAKAYATREEIWRRADASYRLLHRAFKWAEATLPGLSVAPPWYVEARDLFPGIVDPE